VHVLRSLLLSRSAVGLQVLTYHMRGFVSRPLCAPFHWQPAALHPVWDSELLGHVPAEVRQGVQGKCAIWGSMPNLQQLG
jgi:hypothetical protein